MSASTTTTLFDSPLIRISGIACRHPRGGCGYERGGERTHLTLLRRGGFGYHVDGTVVIGDPAMALLYRAGDSYRISHPFDGGDDHRVGVTPRVARESMRSTRLWRLGRNLIVHPTGAD
jgi:AraC family transcriptional regulator